MDPSTLSLFVATPQQTEISRRRTGVTPWGSGMTLDEYIQRDLDLEKSECGKDGKHTTWVLAPRSDPETLDFLCSCETFRRTGLVVMAKDDFEASNAASKKGSGSVVEVECYGIASVFTPPQNRKKGYAHLMMSLLHWVIAEHVLPSNAFPTLVWGQQPAPPPELKMGQAAFSCLWSDVGDFYETCNPDVADRTKRNGWTGRGTRTTRWRPKHDLNSTGSTFGDLESRWLNEAEVKQLMMHDSERMGEELYRYWLHSTAETKAVFTFLPSDGVEAFQRERLRHFWEKEGIDRWGVTLSGTHTSGGALIAFATWTLELRPPAPRTLVITRLYAPEPEYVAHILWKVWEYSIEHDIAVVEAWNFPEHLRGEGYEHARRWFSPVQEKEEFERAEHLPAFKFYDSSSKLGGHQVEWLFNEKFCWC
ncbi:hypothetical protein BDP27DRAFT_1441423 [Rhodocollybia butyracea]|uniref:LYC1 C-terminal domain-containing protein n=1 Tax=Rhodocollybia butyracea TaxID=206335 RepID=A0A9P5UG93_9AGAR|nr:hypothetical protein BDP27DRAFT_1441423 [Rhodocollybia butyracea]